MEIKVSLYEKSKIYEEMLEKNFGKNLEFCLVPGKTIVIKLIDNKKTIGTICFIDNKDLIDFMKKNNEDALNNYCIRAIKGGHIYNFTVNKKYRGKGFGYKLIKICMNVLKKLEYKYCHCHVKNKSVSKKMFAKLGFTEENVINTETRISDNNTFEVENNLVNMTSWI